MFPFVEVLNLTFSINVTEKRRDIIRALHPTEMMFPQNGRKLMVATATFRHRTVSILESFPG